MKALRSIAVIIAAAAMVSLGSGCTVVGLGIGYALDSSSDVTSEATPSNALATLELFEPITVSMRDGSVYEGQYLGSQRESRDSVTQENEETLVTTDSRTDGANAGADEIARIHPGDTITLYFRTGYSTPCIYRDADGEMVYFQNPGADIVRQVSCAGISRIDLADGQTVSSPVADQFIHSGLRSDLTMSLQAAESVMRLHVHDIRSITRMRKPTSARLLLTAAGLFSDLVIATIIRGSPIISFSGR